MLVLSRKQAEKIVIDDRIIVSIVSIRGDRVRIGIDAPSDVPVLRKELCQNGEARKGMLCNTSSN